TRRRPYMLEAMVSRLYGHSSSSGAPRSSDPDCIELLERQLLAAGILDDAARKAVHDEAYKEADAAVAQAMREPKPRAEDIERFRPRTSFLQKIPQFHRHYRYLLPLMPRAGRSWQLPACDLVVSSSHCVAKGVDVPSGVPHVCYCFTPMRYAWHIRASYGWR